MAHPPIFHLSVNLPNIISAHQRFIADEAQGMPYLSVNWESACQEIGVLHPTNNFL